MGSITLTNPVAGTEITAGLHATNYSALQTLLNGNLDNVNISASATLDAVSRTGVRKNSAGSTFNRRRHNFIEGSGILLTVADDSANEEVDITIATSASSGYLKLLSSAPAATPDVVNTTTETDLVNYTVTGGTLGTSNVVRVTVSGDFLNNTGVSANGRPLFKLKYDGSDVVSSTPTEFATGATRWSFTVSAVLQANAATNSQRGAITVVGGVLVTNAPTFSTTTADSTADKVLRLTVTHPTASANLSIRVNSIIIEKLA